MSYPSYLNLTEREWNNRIDTALSMLNSCTMCPKNCQVNRLKNELGFCRIGRYSRVNNAYRNIGEEKCLVGIGGSGTIFFSQCNLQCVFCHNFEISQLGFGKDVTPHKLASTMIKLQQKGCININFVTPTSNIAQILEALPIAIDLGLNIPLIYNTNSYDNVKSLKLLDGIFDIYLADIKFGDEASAKKYCLEKNYFSISKKAVKEMHRQAGDLILDENGIAIKGLIIRHLILPGNMEGSKNVMEFISQDISKNTCINIMDQYQPIYKAEKYPEINRYISLEEYKQVIDFAKEQGFSRIIKI